MIDLLGIASAVKAVAADTPGVREALLGPNASLPATPAAEVILGDGRLSTLAAGGSDTLQAVRLQVVFYVALTQNLETDELTLLPVVQGFIGAVLDEEFDYTLNGLVEDVRVIGFEFDVVKRNNLWYRYGSVELIAGEVDGEV